MTHLLPFVRTSPFRVAAAMVMVWTTALVALPATGESATAELFVPIVLSSGGAAGSFYTTELTLSNRGTTPATVEVTYTAAFGEGSGKFQEPLQAGEQRVIPDTTAFLVTRGLPLPATGNRGGTLRLRFFGLSSADAAAATARTTTATVSPQPAGAAGLAYAGSPPQAGLKSKASATLYGLRANAQDRSNVAIYSPSGGGKVRVTAFAGDGSGASVVKAGALDLPEFGWTQLSGVFDDTGFANGWVTVEMTEGYGSIGAYGVVNCNGTSDGSYVTPTTPDVAGSRITVPVLVETTSGFRSELVLANRGGSDADLVLGYSESLSRTLGAGGKVSLKLKPREQLIIPDALEYLRGKGLGIGAKGAASYAGALRVSVAAAALSDVFAGARTASLSPSAGQFGLFTPGVYEGHEAQAEAWLYGLRADATNRTNVAVLNAGADGAGAVTLELQVYDGDAGGIPRGDSDQVTLEPGGWAQKSGFLGSKGVANGWVRVRRLSGTTPWVAYAVVNDGAGPGERTGDGAYVPMVATPPPSPWEISILKEGGHLYGAAVTYDPSGNPTICYSNSQEVRAARWDRSTSSWQVASLGPGGTSTLNHRPALATDPRDGNPSVVSGVGTLQFAHWTGSSWKIETVENAGEISNFVSLVYGPDGNPSISYRAETPTTGLRFAKWNGSAWVTQSVDPDPTVGAGTSLAFDSRGNPAIAYGVRTVEGPVDTLKLARWTGSAWRTEIVEGGVVPFGYHPSLAFDAEGMPAIAHGRALDGLTGLRFVRWDGQRWVGEVVSPHGELGRLTFDRSGRPLVGFTSQSPGSVWLSRREAGRGWTAELVEGPLSYARSDMATPMLELDPEGRPSLVYERAQTGADGVRVYSIGFARKTAE